MKIGKFTYPDATLRESIEDAKKIYDRFTDQEVEGDLISETIGYAGGSFTQHLSSLRKYGLITPRGKIKITQLGKKITYPASRETELEAIEEAIMNVELFAVLYNRFGYELPDEKFWVNLVNITGAEAPIAQEKEETIYRIYMESVAPLALKESQQLPQKVSDMQVRKEEVPTADDFLVIKHDTPDLKYTIQIRKDIRALEFVKTKLMDKLLPDIEYEEWKIKSRSKQSSEE